MVNLNVEIYDLLRSLPNVTVLKEFPDTPPKVPLITYNEIGNVAFAAAENAEYLSRVDFQVDCWAKTSLEVSDLGLQVNNLLTDNGYWRKMAYELKDTVSGLNRKLMRFEKII